MYAESWGPKYATNKGQYRGADHYMIQYSFGYSNSTNAGSPNALAAVYQARSDILWPANSAQAYCSSVLGYTIPVTITSVVVSVTPSATTTVTSSQTDFITVTNTHLTTAYTTSNAVAQKRALAIPNVLTKYPVGIVTSACSLAVKPASSTSVVTVTTTRTAATVFSTQQADVTTLITSTVDVSSTTTLVTVVTPACSSGKAICTAGSGCIDLTSDNNNCGACDNVVSPANLPSHLIPMTNQYSARPA
jgi:hypothetical protein